MLHATGNVEGAIVVAYNFACNGCKDWKRCLRSAISSLAGRSVLDSFSTDFRLNPCNILVLNWVSVRPALLQACLHSESVVGDVICVSLIAVLLRR